MGLELDHVISDESHYGPYECAICQALIDLDALVTTSCSHAFCRSCLYKWLVNTNKNNRLREDSNNSEGDNENYYCKEPKCPTCNHDLLYCKNINNGSSRRNGTMMMGDHCVMVEPLQYSQPLAYRVLKRIQVACPLNSRNGICCEWKGDYGDLQHHFIHATHQTKTNTTTTATGTTNEITTTSATTTTTTTTSSSLSTTTTEPMEVDDGEQNKNDADQVPNSNESNANESTNPIENNTNNNNNNDNNNTKSETELWWETIVENRAAAQALKEEANAQFATSHYTQARQLYTKALHVLMPTTTTTDSNSATAKEQTLVNTVLDQVNKNKNETNNAAAAAAATVVLDVQKVVSTLFLNRAACHAAEHDFVASAAHAATALSVHPTYTKAALRLSRSYAQLGQFTRSIETIQQTLQKLQQQTTETTSVAAAGAEQNNQQQNHQNAVNQQQQHEVLVLEKELKKMTQLDEQMRNATTLLGQREYAKAKMVVGQVLKSHATLCNHCSRVLLAAARADLGLGLTDSVLRLTQQVLTKNIHHKNKRTADEQQQQQQYFCYDDAIAEGYRIRGHCLFLMGDDSNENSGSSNNSNSNNHSHGIDTGLKLMRESIRLDPENAEATALWKECKTVASLLQQAKDKAFTRQFDAVVELTTRAIETCQKSRVLSLPPQSNLYGRLHTERATAHLRLQQYPAALKDCAHVLYHRDDWIDAWLVRFQVLHQQEKYTEERDESRALLEKLSGAGTNGSNSPAQMRKLYHAYERADFEIRKQARPDFYKILGVATIASEREIKQAYKQRAFQYHPDKWTGPDYTNEQRQQAQEQFQLLGQALEILTDDFTRKLYDQGYDPEAIRERVAAATNNNNCHNPHTSATH